MTLTLTTVLVYLAAVAFQVFIAWFVIWVGRPLALGFLADLSGWTTLADLYAGPVPTKPTFRWCAAQLGQVRMSGTLNIAMDPDHLTLYPSWLFRPAHPPLRVPWNDVVATRKSGILWIRSNSDSPRLLAFRLESPCVWRALERESHRKLLR